MMRIAMANHCYGVAALFFLSFAHLLLGVVGESSLDLHVPMINLKDQLFDYRPRERRLTTASVWCIAKSNVSDTSLQGSLDWVCGPLENQGQVNCGPVQVGGSCYDPDTLQHHANWAFNAYFQRMNATDEACDFQGTAQKVTTDPSSGTCIFPAANVTVNGTATPPTANSPGVSPGSPPGSPVYSPNSANVAFEPGYFFRVSTALVLISYLFT